MMPKPIRRLIRRVRGMFWIFKIRFVKRPSDKNHDWLLERPADVLIVGAAKCGTSSLHRYLGQHPDIHSTAKKEHHYYCQTVDDILAYGLTRKNKKVRNRYQMELDEASPGQLRVESSPTYLGHPEAAARVHKQNPDVKIIIMTRDCADRVRSNFLMFKRVGQEQRSFEEFQREGAPLWRQGIPYGEPYLRYGHIGQHATRYVKLFPRQNVFVGAMEDMADNPLEFMAAVAEFLGVDPAPFDDVEYKAVNAAWRKMPDQWIPEAKEAIEEYYQVDQRLFEKVLRGGPE